MRKLYLLLFSLFLILWAFSNAKASADAPTPSLREVYADDFLLGATLTMGMLGDPGHSAYSVVEKHFAALSSDNAMKWAAMNPDPGVFQLVAADRFVEYGTAQGMELVGHVLFWHSQTPDWVFEDAQGQPLSREALLERMRERAEFMAARYADRVKIWDVVNESILGDGSWRQSKFQQIIGDDFTEQAFRIADAVMPDDAALLYNDYGMTTPGRRDAVVAMVKDFQEKGIRIDGIGMQGHWTMGFPALEEIETAIEILSSTGLPLHITELDLDLLGRSQFLGADVDLSRIEVTPENNPFADGALPPEESARFTQRYGELFELLVRHSDKIDRVTFWGVGDGDSWLNFWPVRGRTNFALLFDRDYQPKPAFFRVLEMGMEQ